MGMKEALKGLRDVALEQHKHAFEGLIETAVKGEKDGVDVPTALGMRMVELTETGDPRDEALCCCLVEILEQMRAEVARRIKLEAVQTVHGDIDPSDN